jgi:hypothetical protein
VAEYSITSIGEVRADLERMRSGMHEPSSTEIILAMEKITVILDQLAAMIIKQATR